MDAKSTPNSISQAQTMSEEAVATAMSRSGRPAKRAKASDKQSNEVEALFANPDRALEKMVAPKPKTVAAPPEIVANVQGSSAGAGSGEFHVYKASRRREYDRLRVMDEEVEREKADQEWEEKRAEVKGKEDAKLSRNRARREKQKARQAKAKGGDETVQSASGGADGAQIMKKKLVFAKSSTVTTNGNDDDMAPGIVEETGITIMEDD